MLPSIRKWEGDEHMLSNLEKDYRHRVERLQQYVPFLRKMIEHLEGARDKNRETQLIKMRSLFNILTDSHKKLKPTTIQRCEEILQKLYSKVEGVFDWSTGLPSVKEKLNVEVDKDFVEKEDAQNSNGSIQSPLITESPLSVESSSRDDSCSSLWRRRKTAMEFFEETPRSPSPPTCSDSGTVPQPLVIPMERKEESCENRVRSVENPPRTLEVPIRSLENPTRTLEVPMRSLENVIRIPLEPAINESIMALLESKVELPPKPPPVPYERREDFKSKWYQGESRCEDTARSKSNFSVANSARPSDSGVSHSNNVAQPPFMQEMSNYSPLQCVNSKNTNDIPSLEELRIPRRGDLEYHNSERMHIPISGGGKYVKDYDHCKQPSGGWKDVMFERRRNMLPFKHQPEPSNITVIGKAQVYDYGHGQDSASDSLESAKDTSAQMKNTESESDKVKVSPKNASSPRVSIREKLALEINKVHRVGISSGGALRSLSKDLGSPPHHKKVENRDVGQSVDTSIRKTSIPVKPKDGEHTPEKNSSKDRERRPSGCVNFAEDDFPLMNSSASFYLPEDNLAGVSSDSEEKRLPLSSHDAGKDDSANKMPKKGESKSASCSQPESIVRGVSPDVKVVEEFSFKKKLLESKGSPDGSVTDSPTSASVVVATIEDEDQSSKMSICDADSDSDSKIPFLESTDAVPPDKPNFLPSNTSSGFSDQRHLPSPSISPAPSLSSSNAIQPFVNPSNPNLPTSQGNSREEPTNARIWPSPNPSGMSSFPPFCPKGIMQPKAIHQNAMQQSVMQQNVLQQSIMQQNAMQQSVMQQSVMQQSVMQQNVMQQNIMQQNSMQHSVMQQNAVHQSAIQQNPVQKNVNSPNMNNGNQAVHPSITSPSHIIPPNKSSHSHNIRMDTPHLTQQPQFMSGGNHSPHAMNVQSINQVSRPQVKHGLLPDPGAQFRHGGPHNWSQGHGNPKAGLLPLPVPRPNWRKESYSRPSMNQYVAEPRSLPASTCDARPISVRGSWNSRRGSYSKVNDSRDPRNDSRDPRKDSRDPRNDSRDPRNDSRDPRNDSRDPRNDSRDPRMRKPDHSRPYYDSPEPLKKSEEKFWKHPSDPRRANPSVLENKHPTPPVAKDKSTISSPLNSLYDADQTPKTGKGYGLQKFRIPKIKSHEVKDSTFRAHIIPRAPTPPRGMRDRSASCESVRADDRAGSCEDIRADNRTGSSENIRADEEMKEDKASNASTKEDSKEVSGSNEILQSDEKKEEEGGEDKEKKTKEEFTKELFQTLLKFSLEAKDGSNLLDNSKFLDELREKLKLNPRKKSRPIIESDTESSEEEEECSPLVNKTKKRCRVIIESSESDNGGDDKPDEIVVDSVVKSPEKTPPRARRTPRSGKAVKELSTDAAEERPRTRSQRKLFNIEEDQVVEMHKSEEPLGEEGGDHHDEGEGNVAGVSNEFGENSKTKAPNRRTKRRSSLELLQEDIREMFICEGVLSATGVRMCRLLKEAAIGASGTDELPLENNAVKETEEWEVNSVSCKDSTAPDNSDENCEIAPPRVTRKRGCNRKDTKVSSLQPRVLLKKSEVVDACDYPRAPQTAVRGGFARRSLRRTPNLGVRHQNSRNSEDVSSKEAEESENNEKEESKKDFLDGRELRSRTSLNKSSKDDKKAQLAEGDGISQLNDDGSVESSDDSCDGSNSLGGCDTNEVSCGSSTSISGKNEGEAEVEGKENIVHSVIPGKKASRVIIKRSSFKKVNSKAKRSKVNRRWALGVLKRAVNHKRRGLKSASSSGIIRKETHSIENVKLPAPEEDLTDINYTCVGNESARCKLCSYSGKQIVNHYVTKHPESDVIVSRLSLQQAKTAMDWTEVNQGALKNAKQAYLSSGPFVCLMCEAWFTEYMEFFDHVTTHTGEYRFSCKKCSYRSFRDSNVRSHAYYVHQIKYCESSQCFNVMSVEDMSSKFEEGGDELENSSSVIPGLVAHMCSKCNFVQIAEENVKDHIAKRHGEDVIKILKIDLSLISPEPPSLPSETSDQIQDEEEDDAANSISEETNVSSRDDDDTNTSFKDCHSNKVEIRADDLVEMAQVKKEKAEADESSEVIEIDETAFIIDNDLLHDSSNKNCNGVWAELLENPECDAEISVIKLKLVVKIEDTEDKSTKSSCPDAREITGVSQSVGSKLSNISSVENESSKVDPANEIAGVHDFGVIHLEGGKEPEERKANRIESQSSEVEIIEIYDSDSSSSEDSSEDESESESEKEWTAPTYSNKESLFSLGIIPDVKAQNNLLNITNKLMKIKERVVDLETKADFLVGGDIDDFGEAPEENEETAETVEVEQDTQDISSAPKIGVEEVPEIRPGKIRVRCLSGDLLSSTRDSNHKDEHVNSERDPFIDVIGSPLGFDSSTDNPLCQISSVCSLHPNEQVPEEFIKAVSENETPDLTSLAAYTPTTGSPQSLATPEEMAGENIHYYSPTKGGRYRPILPKPAFPMATPPARLAQNDNLIATNGRDSLKKVRRQRKGRGVSEELSDFQSSPPKSCIEPEEASAQPCNQVKICSIMRASLYAKASKTPTVFSQVLSNQVKLCHLFKCMGRQCSFTTDESVVFLSHYLGHESLASDPPDASSSLSGENNDNQEKRFDWQQCSYCAEMFSSASAYVNHVKIEHGECAYQCPYCFYRAAAVSYVILHQNSTHITEKVSVLHCKNPLKKGCDDNSDLSLTKLHIEPYVCFQGNCKRSFYSPNRYLTHLQLEHSALSMFCCHKCGYQCFKAERLLQHYKLHSFFLYQCVYCEQGSDTSEEILQHLASFHPNKKASVCKRNCQETSNGSARTTGRHPYILFEDIELTEMENVEVVNVGDETGKKSLVTIMVNKAVASREIDPNSNQMEEFTEMDDDDNSDDEDNLVIAEEPEEEASAKENDDSIMEMETPRIREETKEMDYHREENVVEEACHEKELTQEKVIEKENPETVPSGGEIHGSDNQYIESESGKKKSKQVHGGEKVRVEMAEDLLLSSPTSSGKSSRRNSATKPPNLEELGMSPRRSKSSRNRDELNVSTTDDEIIDVGENNRGQEMRLLRRRDVRRSSGITTRSQVEPKSKSTPEESQNSANPAKETASPKEPSNGKVDLSELYHCCFAGCSHLAKDLNSLKYHMKSCPNSKDGKEYVCPHCSRKFKLLLPALRHLRVHGKKNYVCMICDYQGHNMNLAVRHVKFRHRASAATVSPLTDWDEPEEIQSSVKDQKLVVVAPKEVSLPVLLKRRFIPDDADFLPLPCVYTHEAKCGRCSYSTKVRVNMRRHLYLHLKFSQAMVDGIYDSSHVPWSVKDAVNPMPCLEGKEMMFDKMTNWALSSHLDAMVKDEDVKGESRRNSAISEYEDDNFIPRYVPENERYVCGVISCHYHTVDDTMLRHHLRALHRDEATFRCPHCPEEQNALLQVPVDRLASHLKMHDDQLYQCIHCNYFHFQRRFVERHAVDKHCDLSYLVNVIREPDTCSKTSSGPGSSGMAGAGSDGSNRSARSSSATNETTRHENDNMWNCGLCSFSCSNRESISDHARTIHSVFSQYVCGMCSFRTAYLSSFNTHFSSKHLGYPVQLVANYFPSNIAKLALPTVTISLPNGKIIFPPNPSLKKNVDIRIEPVIEVWPYVEQGFGKSTSSSVRLKELNSTYPWQRCMPRVRYIRGIPLAEEGEETMYDLAESLKILDVIQNEDATKEEEDDSPCEKLEMEESEVLLVDESGGGTDRVEDADGSHEHPPEEGMRKGAKRRMSDTWQKDCAPVESRRMTENGNPLTPVKASPSKKSAGGSLSSSPVQAKIPKMEAPQESLVAEEKLPEEGGSVASENVNQESEKHFQVSSKQSQESDRQSQESEKWPEESPISSKVEYLIKQYGEFGEPEGNLFVCPLCSKYKTKYRGDMKDHYFRELNYKRFVCTHCGFLAPVKNRLQKHYFRVHKKEGKREAIAELPPDSDIELWVTLALNHQCEIMKSMVNNSASGSMNTEGNMGSGASSSQTHPVEGGSSKASYGCKYCGGKFSTVRGVKQHFKVHHLKIGSWICGYCDVCANSSAIILKHSKGSHPERQELILHNSIGSFIDAKALDDTISYNNLVSKAADENGSIDVAASKNSEIPVLYCSNCDYQTKELGDMKIHEKSHTFGCGHCLYTSAEESDINIHHLRNHSSLPPKIINRSGDKGDQNKVKSSSNHTGAGDGDITVIDLCSEPEDTKDADDDVAVEQEIIVTLENIGEYGKSNPSFVFKCYYCRMKSFLCDDVVNHWEKAHLPTDIHNTHPFKCKRIFAMNHFTFPHQLFQCTTCNHKGTVTELKGHFKTEHPSVNFKVLNMQNTKYCCLLCDFSSFTFTVLENHFKNLHTSKDLEYRMKLANVGECNSDKRSRAEDGIVFGRVVGNSFKGNSKRDSSEEEQFLKDAVYSCCICNSTYSSFNIFEKHHAQKHDSSTLRFTISVKPGKSNDNPLHLSENIVKTYSCSSCPFSTQSFSKMFEHIRGHALPYKCGRCDFKAEVPSQVHQHHYDVHPIISSPMIVISPGADLEMAHMYKEMKVTCEVVEPKVNTLKRRAQSPLGCEPKKCRPVARKSTTQVFPGRSFQKPTARKSTNPSIGFVRNLKSFPESPKFDRGLSSNDEQDSDSAMSDVEVDETMTRPTPVQEFSYYTGGKGQGRQPVNLSRITVWMTFGGCAAKRVPVSKMAQLVDLEPNLCIVDVMKEKRGS